MDSDRHGYKLMKKVNKIIARGKKLINKIESNKLAYHNRVQSVPENATIRKEYIKCKKIQLLS
jgi:hypothetical protein